MRLAFADTRWYVADPGFQPISPRGVALRRSMPDDRRRLIDPQTSNLDQAMERPLASS